MKRILTRKWFWLLVGTAAPALWQVLTADALADAARQGESAARLKAAMEVCRHLEPMACGG